MANYAEALQRGFEAARNADAARKEIDEIFNDLNDQVSRATGGKVSIERNPFPPRPDPTAPPLPRKRVLGIVASNPSVRGRDVGLAEWAQDRSGYPCRVTWNKQEHVCEDAEALTACLSELLMDPVVGQKIYTLTKLDAPQSAGDV